MHLRVTSFRDASTCEPYQTFITLFLIRDLFKCFAHEDAIGLRALFCPQGAQQRVSEILWDDIPPHVNMLFPEAPRIDENLFGVTFVSLNEITYSVSDVFLTGWEGELFCCSQVGYIIFCAVPLV